MAPLGRTSPATRVLLRVLAALMVAAALLLVHATTAQAAPPDPAGAAYSARCATTDASAAARVAGDDLLPVNRWSPATNNFHSRTDGVLGALNAVQRDVGAGMFMSIGNGLWAVTSDITLFAARFCILDTAGTAVDATAGDLMKSLVSGGLAPYLVALIVGAFGFGIWNGYRRRGAVDWKQMGLKAGAVALLITLMTGAQATNPDRGTFGAGSPGWWVTTANDTISDIGSAPALFTAQAETAGDQSDPLSCEAYVTELKQTYQQRYRSSLTSSAASMPIVLNSIWEQTGMEAWKTAQFGQSEYADRVFCRLMDQFADVPVGVWPIDDGNLQQDAAQQRAAKWYQDNGRSTVLAIMSRIPGVPEVPYPNSIAFTPVNDITRDVSVVGWAVCDYDSGRWRYANDSLVANDIPADHAGTSKDDGSIYPNQNAGGQGCAGWWSERAVAGSGGFNDGRSAFDWEANPEKIYNELSGPEQDFMLTLHSYKAGSSVAVAFWYAVSALFMFAVFGLVSMGIVLAKFAMVVMMIGIVGVIVSALLPRAGASDRLGGFAKTMLGLMLLTTMTMAVFSVLGQLTKLSMDAGLRVFEPGTIGAMFWAAASPVIAVFSLHWLFKMLRPGFGAGSDSRKDEGLWQHRGSTARSCGSGPRGWRWRRSLTRPRSMGRSGVSRPSWMFIPRRCAPGCAPRRSMPASVRVCPRT